VSDSRVSSNTRAPRRSTSLLLLEAARPKQWIKNAFVLAGMVFSGNAFNATAEARVWAMVVAFCLASSATYLLNDALDAEADRLNPRTAGRPIARGDLGRTTAFVASAITAVLALALSFALSWQSGAVVAAYIVLQLGYSFGLKRIALIDILVLSMGFVLRALGGLVVIPVEVSDWLLVCTGFLALLLGLGKRRGEMVSAAAGRTSARASIDGYTLPLIDQLVAVTTATILVSYTIYAIIGSHARYMGITIPFVVYGVLRVLQLMQQDSRTTEDPSALVLRDRPLQVCVILWGLAALIISTVQ
jgi:4-hydroxybenzoate polyprenyltransferase